MFVFLYFIVSYSHELILVGLIRKVFTKKNK